MLWSWPVWKSGTSIPGELSRFCSPVLWLLILFSVSGCQGLKGLCITTYSSILISTPDTSSSALNRIIDCAEQFLARAEPDFSVYLSLKKFLRGAPLYLGPYDADNSEDTSDDDVLRWQLIFYLNDCFLRKGLSTVYLDRGLILAKGLVHYFNKVWPLYSWSRVLADVLGRGTNPYNRPDARSLSWMPL